MGLSFRCDFDTFMQMWTESLLRGLRDAFFLIVAFSLIAVAFAHRAPSRDQLARDAFVLAGGDLSSVCGSGDIGDQAGHGQDCAACQLGASMLMPEPCANPVSVNFVFEAKIIAPRAARARNRPLNPANRMRAPPLA